MSRVLIIIPAYNEEKSIGGVIDEIVAQTPYRDILVINDGSADTTSHLSRSKGVQVVDLPYNLGIGAAVQTGLKYAVGHGYDYIVRLDADGQHEATQIPMLLSPLIADESDFIIGSRHLLPSGYSSPLARRIGIKILANFMSILTAGRITDTTSGFQAMNRRVAEIFACCYPDDYPEVESIVLLHRMGFRIKEVGVEMTSRSGGKSSITSLRAIYYMVKVIMGALIEMVRDTRLLKSTGNNVQEGR